MCEARCAISGMPHVPPSNAGFELPADLRTELADFVRAHGERQSTEILGLPSQTLARALGGLGVRRATAFLVEARLRSATQR